MAKKAATKKRPLKGATKQRAATKKSVGPKTKKKLATKSKAGAKRKVIAAPQAKPVDPLFKKGGLNNLFQGKGKFKKEIVQEAHNHSFAHEARPISQPPETRIPKQSRPLPQSEPAVERYNRTRGLD